MSNYCDDPFYQQNIYTNTYSLWENSAYYDINNLSPQNYSSSWHRGNDEDFETRYTSGPTEPEPAEPPDHRNRRIVRKTSLYEDPDSFYPDVTYSVSCSLFSDDSWALWHNSGEEHEKGSSVWSMGNMRRPNRVQKKLDNMLAKPVKMTKAESMMQMMGWNGGALGLSGLGIVEPITPNAEYTQSEGDHPHRQICIYKDAPRHVYLIIPDDLRDDPSSEDPSTEQSTSTDNTSDNEAEEETNPFLRSITRNLKKTKDVEKTQKVSNESREASIFYKILEYFNEFTEKRQFGQFKFLGPFSDEERGCIRKFMAKTYQYLNGEPTEYKEIFDKTSFQIAKDVTGNTVINKMPK